MASTLLFFLLLSAEPAFAAFAGGDGSAANPWQIATAQQLNDVRNDLSAHYKLTAHIDLTAATGAASGAFWNGGSGWKPIGSTLGNSFTGSLDGNGYKITGLFINRGGEDVAGFFGWISFGAQLTGLMLEEVNITGGSLAGGLAVTNFGGTIKNNYVSGSVTGNELAGGLVGRNLSGTIEESYFSGTVNGNGIVGQLVGINWATIKNSGSTSTGGTTTGGTSTGGTSTGGTSTGGTSTGGTSTGGTSTGGTSTGGTSTGGTSTGGTSTGGTSTGGTSTGGTSTGETSTGGTSTGGTSTGGTSVNHAPSGTIRLVGSAIQGETLTTSNNLADEDGLGVFSYQWKANGIAIAGATGSSYQLTQKQVGKTITVTVSYLDGGNTSESVSSAATLPVANTNDAPTGKVKISGSPIEDQLLMADTSGLADEDGLGLFSYQWRADDAPIINATDGAYRLTQNEVGKTLTVTVKYRDGGSTSESVTSAASSPIANVNDAPTGTVSITGSPTQGSTLTASSTLADEDGMGTISYQWKADGAPIVGATGATYQLTQNEVGKTITVTAAYTDGQGTNESVNSPATGKVTNENDAPTGNVTIVGTAKEDQTLTADTSSLADKDGLGEFSYQWNADGIAIDFATGATYQLTQQEVGKTITVTVSYVDGGGANESVMSAATNPVVNVNDVPAGGVAIAGIPAAGQTLTAETASLGDEDGLGALTYQWNADGSPIAGATENSYQLTQHEEGKTVTVTVSYLDGGATLESISSHGLLVAVPEDDSVIDGGTVSGEVEGTASDPILIINATVVAGTRLSNVLIGEGTELDADVWIGSNVKFMSENSIPPGLDLTNALPALSWTAGDGRDVPDLSFDVLVSEEGTYLMSIIDSIRLSEGFAPDSAVQDESQGELSITSGDLRATVLPYSVKKASADAEVGVFINDDGDVVFVTENHREVIAHPVVGNHALLQSELDSSALELQYTESATMWVFGVDGDPASMDYLSARADILAVPTDSESEEGVYLRNLPALQGSYMYYLVFRDENGILMQQDLVPMPADWQAVKSALSADIGISEVRISPQGIISMTIDGQPARARMEYEVAHLGAAIGDVEEAASFISAGDVNGDGTEDLQILYPSGDTQLLLMLP